MRRGAHPVKHAGRDGHRRDDNEAEIVSALETCGATVILLSVPGGPDLLVGFRRQTYLMEVKGPTGELTGPQLAWHSTWRGGIVGIVRSSDDALRLIGVLQ